MHVKNKADLLGSEVSSVLEKAGIEEFRPCQEKAILAGLLEWKSLLVCTPTASGKTLIAEIAAMRHIISGKGKAIYIVPLKALASEKYKSFKERYGHLAKVALSVGDKDSAEPYLEKYDFIICTAEKFDSLVRHSSPWIKHVSCMIVDEIHLLNDASRGPTLEIIITIMRQICQNMQIIALSATIGNPESLASWLGAGLVADTWRPVKLKHGVYMDGLIDFNEG